MMGFTDEEKAAWRRLAAQPEGRTVCRAFTRILHRVGPIADPCALQTHELMRSVARDFLTAVEDLDAPNDRTVADTARQLAERARSVRTSGGTVGARRAARRRGSDASGD
jgi:hypothetical protein